MMKGTAGVVLRIILYRPLFRSAMGRVATAGNMHYTALLCLQQRAKECALCLQRRAKECARCRGLQQIFACAHFQCVIALSAAVPGRVSGGKMQAGWLADTAVGRVCTVSVQNHAAESSPQYCIRHVLSQVTHHRSWSPSDCLWPGSLGRPADVTLHEWTPLPPLSQFVHDRHRK